MGSAKGQDQCLGTGISLPQWMKGRGDAGSRYDFDHSSFSPPSHDDSFFCIRYSSQPSTNKALESETSTSNQSGYRPISQILTDNKNSNSSVTQPSVTSSTGPSNIPNIKDIKNIDFSKHPLPCQPFVPAAGGKEKSLISSPPINKPKAAKSQGTDDGFHSEPALCGKSIVHVATRMMSRTLNKNEAISEIGSEDLSSGMEQSASQYQFKRKGSKSLPVTPIASPTSTPDTSPKSRRRVIPNRYFAGSFADNKYQTGWLLSSILGQAREGVIPTARNQIQEVDEDDASPSLERVPSRALSRKKSISSQNLSYIGRSSEQQRDDEPKKSPIYTNVLKAKPAELREMNFWSPTSM